MLLKPRDGKEGCQFRLTEDLLSRKTVCPELQEGCQRMAFLLHIAQGSFKVLILLLFPVLGMCTSSCMLATTGLHCQHRDNIF